MTYLDDPRLRQRWNQISQTTETVTENAAAGIWTFGHRYITPCLGQVGESLEACLVAPCLGDRDERARRRRERDWGARGGGVGGRAGGGEGDERDVEYDFDFYDDWDEDLLGDENTSPPNGGFLGSLGVGSAGGSGSRADDWERLIGGSRGGRGKSSTVNEQPKRKRGMSYGTQGVRRKSTIDGEDPTVIPSTAPLGFLGRLPFKVGGTLRYKPSAANLQDHPGIGRKQRQDGESRPLLDPPSSDEDDSASDRTGDDRTGDEPAVLPKRRQRSGTAGSGNTTDSYRSRNDLFPSDGEGDEDAVPLDDEFTIALDRVTGPGDDRGSTKTRNSKGKRPAGTRKGMSRTASRTTVDSNFSSASPKPGDLKKTKSSSSMQQMQDSIHSIISAASSLGKGSGKKGSGESKASSEANDDAKQMSEVSSPLPRLGSDELLGEETSASETKGIDVRHANLDGNADQSPADDSAKRPQQLEVKQDDAVSDRQTSRSPGNRSKGDDFVAARLPSLA